jgi:hypothetical protein
MITKIGQLHSFLDDALLSLAESYIFGLFVQDGIEDFDFSFPHVFLF